MTKIDDKALDELVKRGRGVLDRCSRYLQGHGGALFSIPANGEDVDLTIDDLLNAITALRARVGELEEKEEQLDDLLDNLHAAGKACDCACGYDYPTDICLKHYAVIKARVKETVRQVTREQLREAVLQAARAYSVYGPLFAKPVPDGFFEAIAGNLNLKIVEEAPKVKGRECHCPGYQPEVGFPGGYACKKWAMIRRERCTITEGGDDDEEK